MVLVTYQKKSGEIIQKKCFNPQYKIGEENSWGWKVIDKEYLWNGKYYHTVEYDRLIDKALRKNIIISNIKKRLKKLYKDVAYCLGIIVLLKLIEVLILHST